MIEDVLLERGYLIGHRDDANAVRLILRVPKVRDPTRPTAKSDRYPLWVYIDDKLVNVSGPFRQQVALEAYLDRKFA